eukprot:m.78404 g.78404  ORF g.78404 m.78404 type:complete len:140 (+) comp11954_c1_seq4:180-599(+)
MPSSSNFFFQIIILIQKTFSFVEMSDGEYEPVSMDGLFDAINKACEPEIHAFNQCMESHNGTNSSNVCEAQKNALANCSQESITLVKTIRRACHHQLQPLLQCIKDNPDTADEVCTPYGDRFYKCSEMVMKHLQQLQEE